jgi:hypothetical protein
MTNAWETTTDDVLTVLDRHGIKVSAERLEEIHGELDHDAIEDGVLCFCSMEAQTNSMLDDIENQLMESEVIPKGDKKFVTTEDDDFDDDDDFDEGDDDEDDDDD